jgi:two-component system sensor histidine kinase BaeS
MRITIATRIFLALTLASLVILTLNAVVTRWNFERSFLEYVAEQEADTISSAASVLAEVYRNEAGWASLRRNPRRWNNLLRPDGGRPPPERRPGPEQRSGGPPPDDPLGLGRRVALQDADGTLIVGRPLNEGTARSVPILVDGQTVGYVTIAPRRQLSNPADQSLSPQVITTPVFRSLTVMSWVTWQATLTSSPKRWRKAACRDSAGLPILRTSCARR